MTTSSTELFRAFTARTIDPAEFRHKDHVVAAYELLSRHNFVQAVTIYTDTIRILAINAGAAQKFNLTITMAFLSLIAERMNSTRHGDCESFCQQNPDLLSMQALNALYSKQRLQSDLAREVFLLPDRQS